MIVLISVWPVFMSLPAIGDFVCDASSTSAGNVGGQVRRGVGVRNALADRGVGVHHARRNRRIVRLEPALEARHRLVHFALGHVDLGAAGPDHDQAIEIVVLLEFLDVRHDLFGQVALGLALLDVGTVEPLDVVLVEDRRPRANLLELRTHLLEQRRLEHAGRFRRAVAVLREDVPAAEDEIVERGQRHDLVDQRRTAFRPLAQTDVTHLGQRADGLGNSFANGDDAGNEGRADGPEADQEHAEFAARGSDVNWSRHKRKLYLSQQSAVTSRQRTGNRRKAVSNHTDRRLLTADC